MGNIWARELPSHRGQREWRTAAYELLLAFCMDDDDERSHTAGVTSSDLMKRDVVICRAHDPVSECARLMFEYDAGLVPVIDADGCVVGVVTDRDLVLRIMADPLRDYATPVHQIMSRDPVTCSPQDDLAAIEKTMAGSQKSRLIVVNQSGRCLGIISLSEVAQIDPEGAGALMNAIVTREASISA